MAAIAYSVDNILQVPHNGVYGNESIAEGYMAAFSTAIVAGDTLDLVKLPAGARVVQAYTVIATAVTTASIAIGVRYADGTSTGGTTGSACISAGNSIAATAVQVASFVPFTNDADTIVYASYTNGGTPGANIAFSAIVKYVATGNK